MLRGRVNLQIRVAADENEASALVCPLDLGARVPVHWGRLGARECDGSALGGVAIVNYHLIEKNARVERRLLPAAADDENSVGIDRGCQVHRVAESRPGSGTGQRDLSDAPPRPRPEVERVDVPERRLEASTADDEDMAGLVSDGSVGTPRRWRLVGRLDGPPQSAAQVQRPAVVQAFVAVSPAKDDELAIHRCRRMCEAPPWFEPRHWHHELLARRLGFRRIVLSLLLEAH